MVEKCAHGSMVNPQIDRCTEPAVENRMYCKHHFEEAMRRVMMVVDPDAMPKRWSGHVRGSQVGQKFHSLSH